MRWLFFVCLFTVHPPHAQSQIRVRTVVYYSLPNWDTSLAGAVKKQQVINDSVYSYPKLKNNRDSTLAMVNYFDSSGNLSERDEVSTSTHAIVKVTNYRYSNNLLSMEDALAQTDFIINNNSGMQRVTRTFDRDSVGNIVTEKVYSYYGDSLKQPSVTTKTWEYDNLGHITKEYVALPTHDAYLYRICEYNDGVLAEEKIYDMQRHWMYSCVYEYDERKKTKSVFLLNQSKNIKTEYFFDSENRIVKLKSYSNRNIYWDYSIDEYNYGKNGLLESQSFKGINGESFFYKHFYTTKK